MKKAHLGTLPVMMILLSVMAWSLAVAKEDPANLSKRSNSLNKITGVPRARPLNINSFVTWMNADGHGNRTARDGEGGYYPRGTSWAIYEDGFEFAGKPYLDAAHALPAKSQPEVRAGGQEYNVGTREGRIIGDGITAVAADPNDADVRIYRIRRDYLQMGVDELRRDAAEVGEMATTAVTQSDIDAILAAYALDWDQWPVAYGAPYVERNGVPGYQKPPAFNSDTLHGKLFLSDSLVTGNYDEPGIAGVDPNLPADQVMWTVFNDLNPYVSARLWGSEPAGLEFQCTIWGYDRNDALGQLFFKKYRIINKGGATVDPATQAKGSFYLDSLYLCQWADPDLGGAGDDLVGCDTTLSMGFVYNANAVDAEYAKFGLVPPAVGYDLLQGPIIPSPGSTAIFDMKGRPGYKNLPMTSFAFFSVGSPIADPPFNYEGAKRWYRMMQGYVPDVSTAVWRLYPSGPFPPSMYPLSGDPVTGTGFVDGLGTDYSPSPSDRRLLLCSGPITMAPGDTQEVVIGVVGGLGSDRLSSVAMMKFNDAFVQQTYNTLFAVPRVPELTSPANDGLLSSGTVAFVWRKASREDTRFWHELSTDSLFLNATVDSTLTDTTCVRSGLAGKYWWRVRSANAAGWGAYSDARSFLVVLSSIKGGPGTPTSFSLEQNYPNPFNPNTNIQLTIDNRQLTIVKVFDVLGREVATLMNEVKDPGTYTVQFDASHLASGVYMYRITAGEFVECRKMLLMK